MYEPKETGVGSQKQIPEQGQGRNPQTSPVKPLHAWIIIALLALTLIVNSIGLVLQVMPVNARAGGANFIPDQSFQSGQPQSLDRPNISTTS
jgi:hypothetical protein